MFFLEFRFGVEVEEGQRAKRSGFDIWVSSESWNRKRQWKLPQLSIGNYMRATPYWIGCSLLRPFET